MTSVKRKRVSKRNKQSWRKHVNIKDIEEFLEEKRSEERLGKSYNELSDKELFTIDTVASNNLKLSKRDKRDLLKNSTPRCFSILQPLTKVPDLITKRDRIDSKEKGKSKIQKIIEEKRQRKLKAKEKIAEKSRAANRARKAANLHKLGDIKNDLWEVEDIIAETCLKDEWFDKNTIRHNMVGLGKMRKHAPSSLRKKASLIPTVEVPHPGMSYNPSFVDHQNLLKEVAESEKKVIKEEKHLNRVTSNMFKKVTPLKQEENWLVEMSEGLLKPGQKEDFHSDSEGEYKAVNSPVKNTKKDERKKRKLKLQRELEHKRKTAKLEKKKISDIYKLKKLKEEIEKRDKKIKMLQMKREKAKQYKLLEPKRLGRRKFENPDLEFNIGEDIPGNLRNVKTEGNLLRDRFTSLQKRNILQPTAMQFKKRPKVKVYDKPSHKVCIGIKGKLNKRF